MKKIHLPFFLVAALAALLWLPNLFTKGMFMDGVYNALFAHNLAHGIGGFWTPQTADYEHPDYWDNPQLSACFLSIWYRFFGDHYWVEKLYSLFCAIIQLALITSLWKICFSKAQEIEKYFWLPCLLFLVIPLTSWCYSGNLMENTMSIFTTASVIVWVLFLRTDKIFLLYSIIGGAFVFLGLLTKGPVALFPLAAPFFFMWEAENFRRRKILIYILLQILVTAVLFVFVFSMDAPKNFLQHYLEVQLLPVLNPSAKANTSHFSILVQLLLALSPLLLLSTVSFVICRKSAFKSRTLLRTAFVFIAIGLSASVPIVFSAKQNKHYLLPSLPLFAIGFACLVLPLVKWTEGKLRDALKEKAVSGIKISCVLVISVCLVLSVKNAGAYSRDENLLTDIEKIQVLVKDEKVIRADWSLYSDWALRANLNRFFDKKICMPDDVAETKFYLTKSKEFGDKFSVTAQLIYSGKVYDLYQTLP